MKIAMVVPEYPPFTIGGGGVVFEALVGQLGSRHEVRVFSACDPYRSWTQNLAPESTEVIRRYPLIPVAAGKPHLRSVLPPNPISAIQLIRDLTSWRPDVGHLHGYGYSIVDMASLVLRWLTIPYIFTNHGYPVTPTSRSLAMRSLYRGYQAIGAGPTNSHALATTSISSDVANQDSALQHDRSLVIENGVTPLPDGTSEDCQLMRDRFHVGDSIVIGAAGRLAWSKGFDTLIASLSSVSARPIVCVIAGADAGEMVPLSKQAAELPHGIRVVFPGQMNREELGVLFTLSSVIAVPSRDEPFGLVALEAMALKRRVVATAVGGMKRFVEQPLGRLVAPDDPSSFASALNSALTAPETPGESSQQQSILTSRSWSVIATSYENLLADACEGAPSRHRNEPR